MKSAIDEGVLSILQIHVIEFLSIIVLLYFITSLKKKNTLKFLGV